MTFPQLQYLLEIHRAGSITQAAKNLFVAQSSVSVALSAIETQENNIRIIYFSETM